MVFEQKNWDMRVRTITKVDKDKEDSNSTYYKLVARDKEGMNEITITSAEPFVGLSAKTGVIQVVLKNSQKSMKDFQKNKEDD